VRFQPVTTGFAGIGLGREPSGAAPEFRRGNRALLDDAPVKWGTLAALVAVWLLRLAHAYGNWTFVVLLPVVFVVGSVLAEVRARRARLPIGGVALPEETPLEWVGLSEPWTPARLAQVDGELALHEFRFDEADSAGASRAVAP